MWAKVVHSTTQDLVYRPAKNYEPYIPGYPVASELILFREIRPFDVQAGG